MTGAPQGSIAAQSCNGPALASADSATISTAAGPPKRRNHERFIAPSQLVAECYASVVDLKFPSFRWQPRLGTSNPNHTRFQRVASVLSNPKFVRRPAPRYSEFRLRHTSARAVTLLDDRRSGGSAPASMSPRDAWPRRSGWYKRA